MNENILTSECEIMPMDDDEEMDIASTFSINSGTKNLLKQPSVGQGLRVKT